MRVATGHSDDWPGITIKPERDSWDLSAAGYLELQVRNVSKTPLTVGLRADSVDSAGHHDTVQKTVRLGAGAQRAAPGDSPAPRPDAVLDSIADLPRWLGIAVAKQVDLVVPDRILLTGELF